MQTRFINSIQDINEESWNKLLEDDSPFLNHRFLEALEQTSCAAPAQGWAPCHLLCEDADGHLLGAMPLYLKSNSYGEFVFDFAWANAYHEAGIQYYPKIISAIPFTPATGTRLLIDGRAGNADEIRTTMLDSALAHVGTTMASSLHVLFPVSEQLDQFSQAGFLVRKDCQFHWHNNDYSDFDEFLSEFTSSKRKKVRRERRRINESNVSFESRNGGQLGPDDWQEIMPLYANTFLRHGRQPYLDLSFFERVSATLPDSIVVFMGRQNERLVAVSICFRSATTLYGRYWGAESFVDSLHFETCYYQGIDYCIRHGLQHFEPGTQGEHKISRGFVPTPTWSAHWLARPDFSRAVDDYLQRERRHIDQYIDVVNQHIPYRNDSADG